MIMTWARMEVSKPEKVGDQRTKNGQRAYERLMCTAYHEAGHAVMGHLVNRRLKTMTIVPQSDTLGHCVHHSPWERLNPEFDTGLRIAVKVGEEITVLYAGMLAEKKMSGRYNWIGAENDMRMMSELTDYVAGQESGERRAYQRWLKFRTKRLLQLPPNWLLVEAVAEALLQEKTLSVKRFNRVIRDAMDKKYGKLTGKFAAEI